MLIIVNFPLSDIRSFLPDRCGKLKAPTWPNPESGKDFIHNCGGVADRKAGGIEGLGETRVCYAKRGFRLPELAQFSLPLSLSPCFRRMYFDGMAVGRLEFGFATPKYKTATFSATEWLEALKFILNLNVTIPFKAGIRATTLFRVNEHLPEFYLRNSTALSSPIGDLLKKGIVASGRPQIFVEFLPIDKFSLPTNSKVEYEGRFFKLTTVKIKVGKQFIKVFVQEVKKESTQTSRTFRANFIRFHNEKTSFEFVIRNIALGNIKPKRGSDESNILQRYLNNSTKLFRNCDKKCKTKLGLDVWRSVIMIQDRISPGELNEFINQMNVLDWRPNIRKNAQVFAKKIQYFEGDYVDMGDKIKANNSIIINRSFNKVKSRFGEETAKALVIVAETIEKSKNQLAAESFDSFNEELQKANPKKSVLRLLWDGVVKALPTITEMTDVVSKISQIFM